MENPDAVEKLWLLLEELVNAAKNHNQKRQEELISEITILFEQTITKQGS